MAVVNGGELVADSDGDHHHKQQQHPPPIRDIKFVGNRNSNVANVIDTTFHRAVHKVRLSALEHNFSEVESVANRQRCSVIVVVKADGYGHGSIPTALYLAEFGADAFAVATLQEGIALRKALQETASTTLGCDENINHYFNLNHTVQATTTVNNGDTTVPGITCRNNALLNQCYRRQSYVTAATSKEQQQQDSMSLITSSAFSAIRDHKRRSLRQAHIRILVLGPPVGFPRCFDDYYHYNIEVMISGPEVAVALYEWVCNTDERKRLQVERAANDIKEQILLDEHGQQLVPWNTNSNSNNNSNSNTNNNNRSSVVLKMKKDGNELSAAAAGTKNANEEEEGTTKADTAVTDNSSQASSIGRLSESSSSSSGVVPQHQIPSATLTNVTGSDLAKEVRKILKNQKFAAETQKQQQQIQQQNQHRKSSGISREQTPLSTPSTVTPVSSSQDMTGKNAAKPTIILTPPISSCSSGGCNIGTNIGPAHVFAGIEDTARHSRIRQKAMSKEEVICLHVADDDGNDHSEQKVNDTVNNQQNCDDNIFNNSSKDGGDSIVASETQVPLTSCTSIDHRTLNNNNKNRKCVTMTKKRLRWHALVDSGMGRLGFRTDAASTDDNSKRKDSVEIIKDLVDLENNLDCPIEFYGMCTHMADASNSTSKYTNSQIDKFKSLLERVRTAGILVPTISTDNSAALLTTNLTHFDSKALLTQNAVDSRGFVRTGGAIYGQRPSFQQLRAVSTLMASVRHVAVLREGETVGYDRAYVAPMNVRIATLTIGFADGYPRELSNGLGSVSIRGHLFPVAGNVCMDMLMVELGSAEDKNGIGAQVIVGDTAILWGPDDGEEGGGHVRLSDVAVSLKTTESALTCGLNKERVLRQYSY